MTSIAELSVRLLRTAALTAAVVVTAGVAGAHAQALNPKPHTDTTAPATPVGPPIRQIVVQGTQRIETATVLSYISIHEGDPYDEQAVDRSLKTLVRDWPVRRREIQLGRCDADRSRSSKTRSSIRSCSKETTRSPRRT